MSLVEGVVYALVSAFGWGVASVLVKLGMRERQAVTANIVRLYFVALLYSVVFLIGGTFSRIASLSLDYLAITFISSQFGFVIGDYFYFNALRRLGVSRTVPITSSYPLWAILWAYLFLGREVNLQLIAGALLVFSAILVVRQAEKREQADRTGFIFALLAPISWSVAITLLDYLSSGLDAFTLAGLRMMFASIGVSLFLPRYFEDVKRLSKREVAVLSGAGFLGLFVGQYAFVKAISSAGSQVATPVTAINPIISASLAILLLGEPPNGRIALGLALAVVGIVLIGLA